MPSPSTGDLVAVCLSDVLTLLCNRHFKSSCPKLNFFYLLSSSLLPLHILHLLHSKPSSLHWMVGFSFLFRPQTLNLFIPQIQPLRHSVYTMFKVYWNLIVSTTSVVSYLVIATWSFSWVTEWHVSLYLHLLLFLLCFQFIFNTMFLFDHVFQSLRSPLGLPSLLRVTGNTFTMVWPSPNSLTSPAYHLPLNYCFLAIPTFLFLGHVKHLCFVVIALVIPTSFQVSSLEICHQFDSFWSC